MEYAALEQLETERLRLRKLTMEDAAPYYQYLGSSEAVTRYMLWDPHQDISQSVQSIEKALRRYETGRCYRWAIAGKKDDALMGVVELLRFDETVGSCSFAYMLGEAFWRQGYATEALRAVFAFAFEKMEITQISADHFADNPASGAVMRKAGMRRTALHQGKYEKHGIYHDAVEYRITARDWFDRM